jgi:muramoyltetrapeptide carboxypeptidase
VTEIQATKFGAVLPDGGTIGVPAPSGPWFNRSDYLRSIEWWEERGYRVKLAEGAWDRDDYVAGDPKTRARDIATMFADPEVDVVQCLWGGTGAAQTLPFLDFETIAEHPKAFIGFSDITALHVAIRRRPVSPRSTASASGRWVIRSGRREQGPDPRVPEGRDDRRHPA